MGMTPHIQAILACLTILCLGASWYPATAILGSILAHVRVGDPLVLQIVTSILIWLGVWLRDSHLCALIPLRKIAPPD